MSPMKDDKKLEKGKGKDDDYVANGSDEEEYEDEEFEEEEEYEYEEEVDDDLKKDTKFKQAGPNAKVDLEDSIDRIVKQAKGGGKDGKKGGGMQEDLKANPKDQLK